MARRNIESREPEPVPESKPGKLARLAKIAVIVGASLMPMAPLGDGELRNAPEAAVPAEAEGKDMSDRECMEFWDTEMAFLKKLVEKEECDNPLILEMYKQRKKEVDEKYHKPVNIKFYGKYAPTERAALQGSVINENGLEIGLAGPAIRDEFARFRNSGRETWKKECEASILVGFLHELDHARTGNIMSPGEALDKERMFMNEVRTWAETCEHVIRPLLEKNAIIAPGEMNVYNDWVEAGRDVNAPAWREKMKKYYGSSF